MGRQFIEGKFMPISLQNLHRNYPLGMADFRSLDFVIDFKKLFVTSSTDADRLF